jgi:hypothetical protein
MLNELMMVIITLGQNKVTYRVTLGQKSDPLFYATISIPQTVSLNLAPVYTQLRLDRYIQARGCESQSNRLPLIFFKATRLTSTTIIELQYLLGVSLQTDRDQFGLATIALFNTKVASAEGQHLINAVVFLGVYLDGWGDVEIHVNAAIFKLQENIYIYYCRHF